MAELLAQQTLRFPRKPIGLLDCEWHDLRRHVAVDLHDLKAAQAVSPSEKQVVGKSEDVHIELTTREQPGPPSDCAFDKIVKVRRENGRRELESARRPDREC